MRGKIASQERPELRNSLQDQMSLQVRGRIPIEVWDKAEVGVWDEVPQSGDPVFSEIWITVRGVGPP